MQFRLAWSCVVLVGLAASARADASGKVLLETWDAAYLGTGKAGFVHTTFREVFRPDGKTAIETSVELSLTVKRFNQSNTMRMETGSIEDKDGKVLGVSMRQFLGKQQSVEIVGTVQGDKLRVVGDGGKLFDKTIAWNDQVIGLHRQHFLLRDRKVKPGDTFTYLSYEPTLNTVVKTKVTVGNEEEVEAAGKKRKLMRVDEQPEKIETKEGSFTPPGMTSWLDKDLYKEVSKVELPGLGQLTLVSSTKAEATDSSGPAATITDIGISQLVKLNRGIPRVHDAESVVYRITLKGDDDPKSAFARDDRQTIEKVKGESFEMHVRSRREPKAVEKPGEVGEEYSKSNFYLNCDDARVKKHAAAAVGKETDDWKKAVAIEKWVNQNIKNKNYSEAFATSDQVAKTLEGDCTEHAVLAAAMCRAVGIPSRTALGLVYTNEKGPSMGFHMWTEAWVKGQWMSLDATLGRGYVGPGHVKIADHSWHDTQSLKPLLPVIRVLGKLSIEVVSVNGKSGMR